MQIRAASAGAALAALALTAGCAARTPPALTAAADSLVVAQRVEHVDAIAREPMVAAHPGGALFVAGYGSPQPTIWRSRDGGSTWTRLDVGGAEAGALGNSDVDLAVAPDGTLYFATMVYDREANEGRSISIGVSGDAGDTWSWTKLSETRFDDRPWVEVAPDGTAHVVWNDGSGVHHAVSRDGGRSWTERRRIHELGGSSHLAVGPRGQIAVRVSPHSASGNRFNAEVNLVAVSTDGGETWIKHAPPPSSPQWDPQAFARWVEPLAFDARGALYAFWTDSTTLRLARSTDLGASWQVWSLGTTERFAFFPYMIARGDGELAAMWFSGWDEELRWHVARIDLPQRARLPRVVHSAPLEPSAWLPAERGSTVLRRDPAGEYFGLIHLADGSIGVATTIQDVAQRRFGFTWWRLAAR